VPIAKDTSWNARTGLGLIAAGWGVLQWAPQCRGAHQKYGVRRASRLQRGFSATLLCLSYAQMFGVPMWVRLCAGLVGWRRINNTRLAISPSNSTQSGFEQGVSR